MDNDDAVSLLVGIEAGAQNSGDSVEQYGLQFEMGKKGQPPRPFMRQTIIDEAQNIEKLIHKSFGFHEGDLEAVAHDLGLYLTQEIRDTLEHGGTKSTKFPLVKEETAKRRKNRSRRNTLSPGIDLGILKSKVNFDVL